jgi:hypothetical protein
MRQYPTLQTGQADNRRSQPNSHWAAERFDRLGELYFILWASVESLQCGDLGNCGIASNSKLSKEILLMPWPSQSCTVSP